MSNLGLALNGNCRIATYQSSIAMSFQALSSTKHITLNNWCASSGLEAYRHHGILFYATNLTAAIDVTHYYTIADINRCSAIGIVYTVAIFSYHGFLTREGVIFTHATAKHIACDIGA